MQSETKKCRNCRKNFTIEPDDFGFYEKIKVPPPTFCPECRRQRRLAWRNDMTLYNRACDLCKKNIISIYSPESDLMVYCVKCWWSDNWDSMSYGQDYDFSRPFFEQMNKLIRKVPYMALINDNGLIGGSLNCEYTQDFAYGKNCYMVFVAWHIENVMYSFFTLAGKDMMDCLNIRSKNEFLYECVRCATSYKLKYSQSTKNCIESSFLDNCTNCTNCFMCAGVRSKKYYFQNKQYSEEEYQKILASYRLDTFSGVEKARKEFDFFVSKRIKKYAQNFHNSSNVVGEEISYSKNLKYCFAAKNSENCRYCDFIIGDKDCYDMATGGELSECYEDITCDNSNRNLFGVFSWKSQDVEYTQHCHTSKSLFGCVGLRNKKYCVLNKQYTKEEYEKLVPKIIKQMNDMPYIDKLGNQYKYGEFYPIQLSPFGYNETVAQEYAPLSKEGALNIGYNWRENIQRTFGKETLLPEQIPDSVNDVKDNILDEVLVCINCKRNYKIVPNELIFYQKMKIPIPRRCFYCRHAARITRRNPFRLWHRSCMCGSVGSPQTTTLHFHGDEKCEIKFETPYAPDRPEIIYCEKCYQQEVY